MTGQDLEARRDEVIRTFNAAAARFDSAGNVFWNMFGARTVERMALEPGWKVLDLACGTGSSAVPAARQVGPEGGVVGMDLAENMLQKARERASREGLENIRFERGDMRSPAYDPGSFDGVLSVFGIFFVSEMEELVSTWWDLLRPGGRLAITSWGEVILEPFMSTFVGMVAELFPDIINRERPWERIKTTAAFRKMIEEGGVTDLELEKEEVSIPVRPDDLWDMVMGSGMRAAIDPLPREEATRIQKDLELWAREEDLTELEASVLYAMATK